MRSVTRRLIAIACFVLLVGALGSSLATEDQPNLEPVPSRDRLMWECFEEKHTAWAYCYKNGGPEFRR